jgi:hypothetical protein
MAKEDKAKKKSPDKDSVPKVTPSKDKDQNDVKSKAKSMLMNHPQITQNARGLFRNENGRTIVEEIVYRGDPKPYDVIMPRNQGDLTDEDLRSLAVHASTLVNKTIYKYDPVLASEEALAMSIRTKDGGKYDGKINASTFQLIMDNMKGMKKSASEAKKVYEDTAVEDAPAEDTTVEDAPLSGIEKGKDNVRTMVKKLQDGAKARAEAKSEKKSEAEKAKAKDIEKEPKPENTEVPKEEKMDKDMLKKEAEALQRKLAAVKELLGEEDGEDKDASQGPGDAEEDQATVKTDNPAEPDDKDDDKNSITSSLDQIAAELEKQKDPELFKMAYQLDQISDILEGKKDASTFESDPDEKFMKTFFKGGLREGDADEKSYMGEFNTDVSKEVNEVKDKKNGKEAGERLPYQKLA